MVTPGGFRSEGSGNEGFWKVEGSEGAEGPNKEENSGRRRF